MLVLFGPAAVLGVLAALAFRRWPSRQTATARALACAAAGALIVAVLAWLVTTHNVVVDLDHDVAPWGVEHAGVGGRRALRAVTRLGSSEVALTALAVTGIVQVVRKRSMPLAIFVVAVGLGEWLLTSWIKDLVDRARPTVTAGAAALGPAFPSGHTTAAAACYAAIAIALGIGLGRTTRATLLGVAVAIAVAVAASRVLLGVHWLSDVIGGLALGWGWCALCVAATSASASGRALFDQPDRGGTVGDVELAHDGRHVGADGRA